MDIWVNHPLSAYFNRQLNLWWKNWPLIFSKTGRIGSFVDIAVYASYESHSCSLVLCIVSHKSGADICMHSWSWPQAVTFHKDDCYSTHAMHIQLHWYSIIWVSYVWFPRQGWYIVFVQSNTRRINCCHHHCN